MNRDGLVCFVFVAAVVVLWSVLPDHEISLVYGGVVRLFTSSIFP